MPEKRLEIMIDKENVNLPLEKYNKLIEKAATLDIMEKMYHNASSIYYSNIIEAVFGKREENN